MRPVKLHVFVTFILLFHACRLSRCRNTMLLKCREKASKERKREKSFNVHELKCLSAKERVALV